MLSISGQLLLGNDLVFVPILDSDRAGGTAKPSRPGGGQALGLSRTLLLGKVQLFVPFPDQDKGK